MNTEAEQRKLPAQITRSNDIATGDACLAPNRPGIYQNPIEIWFDNPEMIERYGGIEATTQLVNWAKAKAPLDPRKDEALPAWVVDVLRLGRIGYKGRIRIVMTHAEDILKYQLGKHQGLEM